MAGSRSIRPTTPQDRMAEKVAGNKWDRLTSAVARWLDMPDLKAIQLIRTGVDFDTLEAWWDGNGPDEVVIPDSIDHAGRWILSALPDVVAGRYNAGQPVWIGAWTPELWALHKDSPNVDVREASWVAERWDRVSA